MAASCSPIADFFLFVTQPAFIYPLRSQRLRERTARFYFFPKDDGNNGLINNDYHYW